MVFQSGLAAARAVSAVKSMNISQQLKDMKLPDLPQAIKRPQVLTHVTREHEDAVQEHPVGKIYLTRECRVFSTYRSRRTSALIVHYLLRLQSKKMLLYYLIIRLLLGAFILA